MKNNFSAASTCPLFQGFSKEEFEKSMACLAPKAANYKKGEIILPAESKIDFVCVILSGSVLVEKEDYNGNVVILAQLGSFEIFGEVFACAKADTGPVSVKATENSDILFISYAKIISVCSEACACHTRLIENMLTVLADKNLMLNRKIEIISKRTIRDKLMCYFELNSGADKRLTLKLKREQLANYICADRSAMSAELGRMCRDKLIALNKNEITLL